MTSLTSHQNNFNLIRILAAMMVLVSHSYPLSTGNPQLEPLRVSLGVTWGSIAVDIFFATSGYLVAGSIARGQNPLHFVINRIIRIYPGLLVALLLTVLISGLWFSSLDILNFLSHPQTWKYLLKNGALLHPAGLEWLLPGTLIGVPWDQGMGGTVNGSLWTLPWELYMYIFLLFSYLATTFLAKYLIPQLGFNLKLFRTAIIFVAAIAVGQDLYLSIFVKHDLPRHMFAMFFCGASIWAMNMDLSKAWRFGFCAFVFVCVVSVISPTKFLPVYIVAIPWIVLSAAYAPTTALFAYNKIGDYSYGTYIYAFPVQQWCAYLFKGIGTWEMTVIAVPVVLTLAAFSWHIVEKKALKFKLSSQNFSSL